MSYRCTTLTFQLDVSPSHKLLLLALSSFADDTGLCWPSINRLSKMAGLTERTIHRLLSDLEAWGCIRRKPRFGNHGQRTSSLYQLFPADIPASAIAKPADVVSMGQVCPEMHDPVFDPPITNEVTAAADRGGVTSMSTGTDTDVIQTSKEQKNDKNHHHNHGVSGDQAGVIDDLLFPDALPAKARVGASKILTGYPTERAQELLDELAGRMLAGGVKVSPLGYLRRLVEIEKSGTFVPELAGAVAAKRERRGPGRVDTSSPPKPASAEMVHQSLTALRKSLGIRGGKK